MNQKQGLWPKWGRATSVDKKQAPIFSSKYFLHGLGKAVWTRRGYEQFADEGYSRNVIANRAIGLVAGGVSQIRWKLFDVARSAKTELREHPLLALLLQPNPLMSHGSFLEAITSHRMISGNCYILAVGGGSNGQPPRELHLLRPDRVTVIAGKSGYPVAYRYSVNSSMQEYACGVGGKPGRVLHLKNFHPLNDFYGLSPVEAAAYSIDMHNQANSWNQALLQNAARPSGALVVKGGDGNGGTLSEEQYWRVKGQIDEQFSGTANAGRPLLLEGGLEWKEMSLSPREMDYIQAKNGAARDIALAFGVPPQLLGIPGDNTYSNLAEARLALWEQTILPMAQQLCDALNPWLGAYFPGQLKLECDLEQVSALFDRRQALWERLEKVSFLSEAEKREMAGFAPVAK